ncbi:Tetratricopeptide repeat family [Coleofasciculus chthonoplastes PCC 7420]|uniref:Tetratricopeptide repeat family n=1 Tax=Coleofasciculus chthonoplastes PCC 7420 TaxID=118168 RepID=B4VNE3_9CYAN|nr:Tetratricopeptide repeat family [Coleofasciculus chthonoplastes PCC 7420]
MPVPTTAYSKLKPTTSSSLAQASTTPSPQQPSTPSKPSESEPEVLISEVIVTGVEGQIKDIIYAAIETKPGTIFNQSKVQADAGIIYSYGTFSDVRWVLQDTRLTFEVKLNPVLRSVEIVGTPTPPQNFIDSIFSEQYGVVLAWQSLAREIERLNQWYQKSDYFFARVVESQPIIMQPQVTEDGTVMLTVSEGKIKDIQVRFLGTKGEIRDEQGKPISGKIPISTILQAMESKPGQVFRRDRLASDLQRIFGLGFFEDVRVSLDYEQDSNQVSVEIDVIEKPDEKSLEELGITPALRQQAIASDVTRSLGEIYFDWEDYQKAQVKFQEVLQIYRATNEKNRQAITLNRIGRVHDAVKEYPEAIANYQEALQTLESIENLVEQAGVLNNLSNTHDELGDLYKDMGNMSASRQEYQLALEYRRKSLSLFQELKTIPPEVEAGVFLNTIGLLYNDLKNYQQAHDIYQQALRLVQTTEQQPNQVAYPYDTFDDITANSKLFSDINFLKGMILFNMGNTYQRSGNYQQAIYAFHTSLSLMQSARQTYERQGFPEFPKDSRAWVLMFESWSAGYLGITYANVREPQLAQKYREEALKVASKIGVNAVENFTRNFFTSFSSDPNLDEVESIRQSRSFWTSFGTQGETIWQIYLADTLAESEEMNDKQQALDLYNQALSQIQENKEFLRANTLNSVGKLLIDIGNPQEAITWHQQALNLLQKLKNSRGEAATLSLLGNAFSNLKQYDQALAFYNQALQMQRELQDSSGEADTRYGIASLERSRGNFIQARNEIEAAIKIVESKPKETETGAGVSFRIESLTEDFRNSVSGQLTGTSYTEIIDAQPLELNSSDYGSYINLASYLESKQRYYEFYIDLLMQQHQKHPERGYDREALELSERSRGRSLQTFVNAATINNETQAQTLAEQNAVALNQPLKFVEIQQLLDQDTLLLEYFLGKERSYLWVVSRDEQSNTSTIKSYVLPKGKDIEQVARRFYDFLTVPSLRVRPNKTAQAGIKLSEMILAPAREQLKQQRLLIAADGILQYIPFSALPIPQADQTLDPENIAASTQPLLVNHEVVNLPSASVLALIRQRQGTRHPAPQELAVFADPVFDLEDKRLVINSDQMAPQFQLFSSALTASTGTHSNPNLPGIIQLYPRLPGTRESAEQILAFVPESERRQLFDFDANLENAASPELQQYNIVHFDTHGILDSQNPEKSGVVLSGVNREGEWQMGLLSPRLVFNLQLPAELIVLSGCRTGLGKQVKGEGLVGLTSSFMYAGAERVVVSLWSVEDRATSELMTRFYQGIFQEQLPVAKALRKAQLSMLQDPQWQLPYYWAAFTLQGEWN